MDEAQPEVQQVGCLLQRKAEHLDLSNLLVQISSHHYQENRERITGVTENIYALLCYVEISYYANAKNRK